MTNSLFAAAKAAAPTTKKGKEKPEVILGQESEELLKTYQEACAAYDTAEATKTVLHGMVLEQGRKSFIDLYKKSGAYPGSFKLVAGQSSVMIVPTDRYAKVDDSRKAELTQKYGDAIITETTKYGFNPVVLEKYQSVIEKMIMECDSIPMQDKMALICAETSAVVTKGTIERLLTFPCAETALIDVQPVIQVKNV